MSNWYVLYVNTGSEDDVKKVILRDIPKVDVRVFKNEKVERKDGITKIVIRPLFPGYVFIKCLLTDQIYYKLVEVPGVIKILGTRSKLNYGNPSPVPDCEMDRVLGYTTGDVIKVSEAVIQNGKIKILSGALLGKERFIKKVNTRKGRVKALLHIYDKPKVIEFSIIIKEP